jgi:hypothetical protein
MMQANHSGAKARSGKPGSKKEKRNAQSLPESSPAFGADPAEPSSSARTRADRSTSCQQDLLGIALSAQNLIRSTANSLQERQNLVDQMDQELEARPNCHCFPPYRRHWQSQALSDSTLHARRP